MRDVDVWNASLSPEPSLLDELAAALSADEKARASRFAFPHLAGRFHAGRGWLRQILAAYARRPAHELIFDYSPQGKPGLRDHPELAFNLSHSGDRMACAVTAGACIGVDIEQIRPGRDVARLARRFFSSMEHDALMRVPEGDREAAFFRCWTRKEAFIKATGEGLSRGLGSFAVAFAEDEPAQLLWMLDSVDAPREWSLTAFTPEPGYAGAVAVRDAHIRVRQIELYSVDDIQNLRI